jgi:hypothetical protein
LGKREPPVNTYILVRTPEKGKKTREMQHFSFGYHFDKLTNRKLTTSSNSNTLTSTEENQLGTYTLPKSQAKHYYISKGKSKTKDIKDEQKNTSIFDGLPIDFSGVNPKQSAKV